MCTDPTYKEWKQSVNEILFLRSLSTDPTYKEWKLSEHGTIQWPNNPYARILPTRNGNEICSIHTSSTISPHGSYLQGMETGYDPKGGMYGFGGTDPTYKEWKQFALTLKNLFQNRTDPTYKEWKPEMKLEIFSKAEQHGSYLQGMETQMFQVLLSRLACARILPTRNGN